MDKQLPKNWVETDVETVTSILDNMRKPVSADERSKRLGNVPYYGATGQAGLIDDFIFNEELILVGEDGAPFFDKFKNVAYLIKGKSWVNNHAHVLKGKENILENKFLLHFFNQFDYTNYVGGTTRLKLNQASLKSIPFPLPPLPEQNRIVAKLDTLFAQLETIKASMANIPLLLKNFRQQVLTQAANGKLTEEWRKGEKLEETINTTIGQLFSVKTGSTPKRGTSKYYDNAKIPWLKSGQVRNEFISEADEFISEIAVKETNAKIYPIDTLLVAMYGEGKTRGQVGWMKIEAASNQAIAALVNEKMDLITRKYVYNFCLSQYNEIRAEAEGGNQPNLNLSKIKNWKIILPSYQEQQEIVSRVESLFAKADVIEQQYKSLKQKIDTLPQALLHKAFKGELTEQLESDGDAKELLQQIQELKTPTKIAKNTKLEKLKSFNKKLKNYPENEEVLGMVAEGK